MAHMRVPFTTAEGAGSQNILDTDNSKGVKGVPNASSKPKKQRTSQSSRIGDYIYFTPAIGKGSFSKVFLGYHISDTKRPPDYVAIKRIGTTHMKKLTISRIQREIDLLKKLSHKNIVR